MLGRTRSARVTKLVRQCTNGAPAAVVPKFKDGEQVQTVIIGGGVAGAAMAYHLTKAGMNDCILLEKGVFTCGSTWHAAGLCTLYHGGTNLRRWHQYGCDLYKRLEDETGKPTSFHTPGSIRLIEHNNDRIDETRFQMGKARFFENEQYLISPEEIQSLHPLANVEKIWGGVYNPGDGHIDPTSVSNSMIAGAKMRGARFMERCPVIGLEQTPDRKWIVKTEHGTLYADRVINCGGLWGQQVARMAGVFMPAAVIQHQYVITETVPEVADYLKKEGKQLPVLRSLEGSYYLRQERDGLLVGPYEGRDVMLLQDEWNFAAKSNDGAPITFENDLFQPDLDRLGDHLEHAAELVPVFGTAGIKSVVNGPVQWPPDGQAILGPVDDQHVYNFWQCCGYSYGVAQGAGAADYLTSWITDGEPPYELFETDPSRYGAWATKFFASAKVRETYGSNNIVVFPNEERLAGRPLRTTPVYDRLKAKGCVFGFHNGVEQPLWFNKSGEENHYQPSFRRTNWHDAVGEEVQITTEGMGIMDMSTFSKFIISGPNAFKFLDKLSANKLPEVGKLAICHMLTPKGKVLSEMTVTRLKEDEFYIVTGSDMERHDYRWWIQHYPEEGGVDIRNVTKDWTVLGIAGPNAEKVLQKLTTEPIESDDFKFFSHKTMEIGAEDSGSSVALTLRMSFTGLSGFEFHVPCDEMNVLYDNLWRVASELGPVTDFGAYALNSFRLEAGFKFLIPDMSRDYDALDSGIQKFIRMKNRDFIGKPAVAKMKKEGWASGKRCVKVHVESDADDDEDSGRPIADACGDNAIMMKNEKGELEQVGWTTSGGYSHSSKRNLCIAHVNLDCIEDGTKVMVEVLGKLKNGTILGVI